MLSSLPRATPPLDHTNALKGRWFLIVCDKTLSSGIQKHRAMLGHIPIGVSREQSAILPSFLCLPQRSGRDDAQSARHAARAGPPRGAPARWGVERFGKNRSVAGGANAAPASCELQPGTRAQRRQLQRLKLLPKLLGNRVKP